MDLSRKGAAFIRTHEGFVPKWYLDPVRVPTIGIGFTWASGAFRKWWDMNRPGQRFAAGATMTRAEAEEVLLLIIAEEYGAAVNDLLRRQVPQHVFDAAASVVYNCGPGTLTDRWADQLKAGKYDVAAELLRTTRTTAKGVRLKGLVSRRKEEAELLASGDYTIGGRTMPDVEVDAMADGMLVRRERGDAVRQLQTNLRHLGHYEGALDGIFGYGTEAAVMAFQRSAGLDDDGYAGPLTLAAVARAGAPTEPTASAPVERVLIAAPAGFEAPVPVSRSSVVVVGEGGAGAPLRTPEPVMKPNLTPLESTTKANQGAIGAGIGGGGMGAGLVYLWSKTGAFPIEWASDPQAIIILTGIVVTILAPIGAWIGSYRAVDPRLPPAS